MSLLRGDHWLALVWYDLIRPFWPQMYAVVYSRAVRHSLTVPQRMTRSTKIRLSPLCLQSTVLCYFEVLVSLHDTLSSSARFTNRDLICNTAHRHSRSTILIRASSQKHFHFDSAMISPSAIAGVIVGFIAGFFAVFVPFIVTYFRRRRAFIQRHGTASLVCSERDVSVGYKKDFVESIALLEATKEEPEALPVRQNMAVVDDYPLIDLASAYGAEHTGPTSLAQHGIEIRKHLSVDHGLQSVDLTATSSSDSVNLGHETQRGPASDVIHEFAYEEEHLRSIDYTTETIKKETSPFASETLKKTFQKRSEYSAEVLNGPVDSGSAHVRGSRYTQEDYEKALLVAVTTEEPVGTSTRQTVKKAVQKRNVYSAELLSAQVSSGSAHVKGSTHVRGAKYTREEWEKALLVATTTKESATSSTGELAKKTVQKRSEYSAEALSGPLNSGSTASRGSTYTKEETDKALEVLRKQQGDLNIYSHQV
jgi:hypothetical protein